MEISLVVQQLRLCTSHAGWTGSISGWRTKVSYVMGLSQKKNLKIYYKATVI